MHLIFSYLGKNRGVQTNIVHRTDGTGAGQRGRRRSWRFTDREGHSLTLLIVKNVSAQNFRQGGKTIISF